MKLTHFLAYIFAQLLTFCGMALGYNLSDTMVIQVGMVASVVVFMAYSIAEVIAAYDLSYIIPEDEDDGC